MLSKILVPVDGSENSFRALEQTIFLATKIQEAQITVLYIIEHPPTVYIYSPKIIEKLRADYEREYTKILERCKEMANRSGINIHTVLVEGDPASKIIGYSDMGKFDLIIMGSRGMGKFKELIIGSLRAKPKYLDVSDFEWLFRLCSPNNGADNSNSIIHTNKHSKPI